MQIIATKLAPDCTHGLKIIEVATYEGESN